jgi:hypothetical protein
VIPLVFNLDCYLQFEFLQFEKSLEGAAYKTWKTGKENMERGGGSVHHKDWPPCVLAYIQVFLSSNVHLADIAIDVGM